MRWKKRSPFRKTIMKPEENRLTSLLELTGRKCLQLLRAFYYDSLSARADQNCIWFFDDTFRIGSKIQMHREDEKYHSGKINGL